MAATVFIFILGILLGAIAEWWINSRRHHTPVFWLRLKKAEAGDVIVIRSTLYGLRDAENFAEDIRHQAHQLIKQGVELPPLGLIICRPGVEWSVK